MSLWIAVTVTVYFALLGISVGLLLPQVRNRAMLKSAYKKNMHFVVILLQILFFLAPFFVSVIVFGEQAVADQLTPLFALGLSIVVFWVAVLPQLTKAQIFVDFRVDNLGTFKPQIILSANSEHLIVTRIYNTGFSTLKNAMVLLYFGKGFEIVPFSDFKYRGLDFEKEFTIQKENCGALLAPMKNYQTIPPQEWFLFPLIVKTPSVESNHEITLQFGSETSWGLTEHRFIAQIT